jgi:hypothetical protein
MSGFKAKIWLILGVLLLSACSTPANNAGSYFDVAQAIQGGLMFLKALLIPIGLLLLFLGWKTYNWIIALPGIILGAFIGIALNQGNGIAQVVIWAVVGAIFGGSTLAILHGVSIFAISVFFGWMFVEIAWRDIFYWQQATSTPPPVLFFGALIFAIIVLGVYGRLIGLIAALLGSALLGSLWGFGGIYILIVAVVGFGFQYHLAKRMGDDVFRLDSVRKKRRAARQAQKQTRKPKPPDDFYHNQDFDPNAEEMSVVED